jgi:hypothetical protein
MGESWLIHCGIYDRWYESNASNFFLKNCKCNKNGIYVDDLYIFCNYAAIFSHKVSDIFNTLLAQLYKTLYTTVVKFPTST